MLANQVGGNDDLLFDGCSLVAWPDGTVVIAPAWQEGVLLVDLDIPENSKWVGMEEDDALSVGTDSLKILAADSDGREDLDSLIEDITDAVLRD